MEKKIYFDNNATTKIAPSVLEIMIGAYANPLNSSAAHYFGRVGNKIANEARQHVKDFLGAQNYQVIFTSGGTEANNMTLLGFDNYRIISSGIEHPSVYNIAVKKNADLLPVNSDGVVNVADLEEKLQKMPDKNFIVSIMLANNETGVIQPIKELAKLTHQYGGLFHSDIIQAAGKIAIDLEDLNVDLVSVSAHKIKGAQGVGALLIRNGLDINNIMYGGSQEQGRRPGTSNIAGIAGFGEACRLARANLANYQNVAVLRNRLENGLREIAKDKLIIFSNNSERLPNTSYLAVLGIDNQTQMIHLDLNNIAVSAGSACSSGTARPSKTLKVMGFDDEIAKCAIRVSLSSDNNSEEVDQFIKAWSVLYKRNFN